MSKCSSWSKLVTKSAICAKNDLYIRFLFIPWHAKSSWSNTVWYGWCECKHTISEHITSHKWVGYWEHKFKTSYFTQWTSMHWNQGLCTELNIWLGSHFSIAIQFFSMMTTWYAVYEEYTGCHLTPWLYIYIHEHKY